MSSIPSFSGLNTALRGVIAQQRALDVTGHNIANVETAGYSRQEAVLSATNTLNLAAGAVYNGVGAQLGQGVDVLQYRRLRDDFLDLQWRGQNMSAAEAETTAQRLKQVEALVSDQSENGLGQLLSKLYSSWADLANHPESEAAKTAVLSATQNVVAGFNSLSTSLGSLSTQATNAISDTLDAAGPIGRLATEINALNLQINGAVLAGQEPNDLKDRRDLLIDQLSQYGQVSVSTPDASRPGWLRVDFAGAATPLVDTSATPPVTVPTAAAISPTAPGGRLQALQVVVADIAAYSTQLDTLAQSVIAKLNSASPMTPPQSLGILGGSSAGTMTMLATSTSLVPAGVGGTSGANDIALAIASQRGGVAGDWGTLVTRIGTDVATAQANTLTGQRVLDSLTAQRSSTHGVSIDEEMANMLRFQRGYQAAARALTAMDQNLDVLINRTGRVGL